MTCYYFKVFWHLPKFSNLYFRISWRHAWNILWFSFLCILKNLAESIFYLAKKTVAFFISFSQKRILWMFQGLFTYAFLLLSLSIYFMVFRLIEIPINDDAFLTLYKNIHNPIKTHWFTDNKWTRKDSILIC